jgi:hypothetical protein
MQNEKSLLYSEAIDAIRSTSLKKRDEKKIPEEYIVATH